MPNPALEARGHWWLPEHPDHKVAGTLTFSPTEGGELTLIGALRNMFDEGERVAKNGTVTISLTEAAMQASGQYGRIVGEAGNDVYTLEDCFRVHSSNLLFGGQAVEKVHVNRVLKGARFEPGEALEASAVTFSTQHLADWIGESGLSEEWFWREDDGPLTDQPRIRLEARDLPERHFLSSRDHTVRLRHRLRLMGESERCIGEAFSWRVESRVKEPIDSFVDLASDLQDLVSIGIHRAVPFEYMQFWHPDIVSELPDGTSRPLPIDLYVRWNVQPKPDDRGVHPVDMLFSFNDFDGMSGVQRWMDAAERHRASLGRVMASWYAETMFVSDRLLSCAAALEAFDRTRNPSSNRVILKTRLNRCVSFVGIPFVDLIGNRNRWLEVVVRDRNDAAHNLGLRPRTASTETHYLWQSLHWLFVLCILRECKAPEGIFDKLDTYGPYRWLRSRMPAVL